MTGIILFAPQAQGVKKKSRMKNPDPDFKAEFRKNVLAKNIWLRRPIMAVVPLPLINLCHSLAVAPHWPHCLDVPMFPFPFSTGSKRLVVSPACTTGLLTCLGLLSADCFRELAHCHGLHDVIPLCLWVVVVVVVVVFVVMLRH